MRRLVLGDVHGGMKALEQVLERASFNPKEDQLISLGDLCDGWSESAAVVDYIMKLPNHVLVAGNHDYWAAEWLTGESARYIWTSQGGVATIDSYKDYSHKEKKKHGEYLSEAKPYHIDEYNNLYIHGGFDWHYSIEDQDPYNLMWDRDLWNVALFWQKMIDNNAEAGSIKDYNKVFIGHTTTSRHNPALTPVKASNVWNIDQGAGWEGKLTLMDVQTENYWQSDIVKNLYPGVKGR